MNAISIARLIVESKVQRQQEVDALVERAIEALESDARSNRTRTQVTIEPNKGGWVDYELRIAAVKQLKRLGFRASTSERVGGVYLNISIPKELILQAYEETA